MHFHSKITFCYFCILSLLIVNNNFAENTLVMESLQDISNQNDPHEVKIIDGRTNHQINQQLVRYQLQDLTFSKNDTEFFQKVNFLNKENKSLTIEEYRGKIIILHFWATWCGNCINEMRELNEFAKTLEAKEINNKIIIIPISIDARLETISAFYKMKHLDNLKIYHDPNSSYFYKLGLDSVPYTFIIDENGKNIKNISGPIDWNGNPNVIKQIQSLLK